MSRLLHQLLIGASALLLSSTALAQPAHAPAHGARDNASQAERYRGGEGRYESDSRRSLSEGYVDLPRINERELLRLLRRHDAPRATVVLRDDPVHTRNLVRPQLRCDIAFARADGRHYRFESFGRRLATAHLVEAGCRNERG